MKKIGSLFVMLCVLNLLALVGLGAYLLATGRLDKPKAEAILDVLRHQGTPEKFREQVYDIMQASTASAPASQTAAASTNPASDTFVTAEERISISRQAMEKERLRLDNEAQELRHRQELLDALQADIQAKVKQVAADKDAFDKEVALSQNKAKDESFEKALTLYDQLKPKQIKDLFMGMTPEMAAKFLQAMDPDRAGKIISEFKAPPEATFIATVLDRIRTAGTGSALGTGAAGNSAGSPPGT